MRQELGLEAERDGRYVSCDFYWLAALRTARSAVGPNGSRTFVVVLHFSRRGRGHSAVLEMAITSWNHSSMGAWDGATGRRDPFMA